MIQNPSADFVPAADTLEFAARGDLPEKLKNASPESIARFREALSRKDDKAPGGNGSLGDDGADPAETESSSGRQYYRDRSGYPGASSGESRYDYAQGRGSSQDGAPLNNSAPGRGNESSYPFAGAETGRQNAFVNPAATSQTPAGEIRAFDGQSMPQNIPGGFSGNAEAGLRDSFVPGASSFAPAGEIRTADGQSMPQNIPGGFSGNAEAGRQNFSFNPGADTFAPAGENRAPDNQSMPQNIPGGFSGISEAGFRDPFANPGAGSIAPEGELREPDGQGMAGGFSGNPEGPRDPLINPGAGSFAPPGENGGQADMTSKISDSAGRESRYGFAGNQTEGTRAPDGAARAEGRGDMFRETQSFRSFAGSFPDYSRGEPPRRQVSELSDIFSAAFAGRTDAPVSSQGSPAMEAPAPAAPPSDAAAREEIMKIADSLVERILVSDPQSTAGNQVMIRMNAQSQLSGTEILLTRSNDGTLAVVINSANDNQYRKLNEARERLEASLKKLERGSFTVTVNPPAEEASELSETTA
ncbi:hypothetical protein [Succinimonas sp.]|uniref:hypothetical protein n=1 Tax=Succinimonas sp. TaxID=1936151 RepID=UPI00386E055C